MKIYKLTQHKAYHGTNESFEVFNIGFAGNGIDQEGPGIYFTSDKEDAQHYGNNLFSVNLNLNKIVSLTEPAPIEHIKIMILWSLNLNNENELENMSEEEFYETPLSNWDETPELAFQSALNSVLQYDDTAHKMFQTVWYEFYRDEPVEYLKNMKKLGYDGIILPKENVTHYVIFNPDVVEINRSSNLCQYN